MDFDQFISWFFAAQYAKPFSASLGSGGFFLRQCLTVCFCLYKIDDKYGVVIQESIMKKTKRFLLIAVVLIFAIRIYIRSEYRFPNDMESIVSVQIMQCSDTEPWDPSGY